MISSDSLTAVLFFAWGVVGQIAGVAALKGVGDSKRKIDGGLGIPFALASLSPSGFWACHAGYSKNEKIHALFFY